MIPCGTPDEYKRAYIDNGGRTHAYASYRCPAVDFLDKCSEVRKVLPVVPGRKSLSTYHGVQL